MNREDQFRDDQFMKYLVNLNTYWMYVQTEIAHSDHKHSFTVKATKCDLAVCDTDMVDYLRQRENY